jgi:hypothetical protein
MTSTAYTSVLVLVFLLQEMSNKQMLKNLYMRFSRSQKRGPAAIAESKQSSKIQHMGQFWPAKVLAT